MAGNTFGQIFKLTTFGESHGKAIGGIVDGCPAGIEVDFEAIQNDLDRRKPGQNKLTTQRKESDTVSFLSGIFEGKTTGTPIAFRIPNSDQKSKDYDPLRDIFRPSHADFVFQSKYGIRDHRGGGRSSARETASRVAAGGLAKLVLSTSNIQIKGFVTSIGETSINRSIVDKDWKKPENEVRCPDDEVAEQMRKLIENARDEGDTLGGIITLIAKNVPTGLGEPVFDKLHADLGKAMLSINAVKGFEIGSGFAAAKMKGSEHNDIFQSGSEGVSTSTNHSGGVQGGISNGMDIECRIAFKPVASIRKKQETINKEGELVDIRIEGRHDPCVVPRAVPIVEAMAALTLTDHFLRNRTSQI